VFPESELKELKRYQQELISKISMLMKEDRLPTKSEKARWREDNDGVIVAEHPFIGILTFMNPTLAIIFRQCDGNTTLKNIEETMKSKFPEIDPVVISTDVKNAIMQLFASGFLCFQTTNGKLISIVDMIKIFPPPCFPRNSDLRNQLT
jgi:hypothetical protein